MDKNVDAAASFSALAIGCSEAPPTTGNKHEDDALDLVDERYRRQLELLFDRLSAGHPAHQQPNVDGGRRAGPVPQS